MILSRSFFLVLVLTSCHDGGPAPVSPPQEAQTIVRASVDGKKKNLTLAGNDAKPALQSSPSDLSTPIEHGSGDVEQAPSTLHLPDGLLIGQFHDVTVPGDRSLRVAHAREELTRAIVYLHGMCGNPLGADHFADLLTAYGTVIAVRGNVPCEDRPGYRWPQEPEEIEPRIRSALLQISQARNGLLNIEDVALFGYSQGAHRGEKIAQVYPQKYRDLILGGPPTAPTPEKLFASRRVAILGGELEDTEHMIQGDSDLRAAGLSSRFFLLPGAHHGDYGPKGHTVLRSVLEWTWGPPPSFVR